MITVSNPHWVLHYWTATRCTFQPPFTAPRNNEQTWKNLEEYCRQLALSSNSNEVYIICGPAGKGGVGGKGRKETLVASRKNGSGGAITVPSCTWKVILVLPHGKSSPSDVTTNTTTIAVCVPNTQSVVSDWKTYITTVSKIEKLTGLSFFSAVDPIVASTIKKQRYGPKVNFQGRNGTLKEIHSFHLSTALGR